MKAGHTSSKKRRKERRTQQRKQVRELQQLIPGTPQDMDVSWLRELLTNSVEGFAAEAGWRLALLLLEDEVTRRCGPRYSRPEAREVTRYGRQPGVVMIAGQKQGVLRPRIRGRDRGPEIPLETYALLQRPGTMPASTLAKMVHGVSCRSYEQVVETARAGFGVSKSSVSRSFVRASAAELEKLMSRRLDTTRFVALFLDGISFAGEMLIVALGLDETGHKHVLGLRQGDSENAVVCTDLLTELRDRGLDTTRPILAVLDGSKALACAVQKVWGDRVLIQRCQVHKKRNVKEYVAQTHHAELDRRLNLAYHGDDYETSLKQLQDTQKWLRGINPDAASSLGEGLEETLTVLKLGLSDSDSQARLFVRRSRITCAAAAFRRISSPICRCSSGRCSRFNTNRASSAIAARTRSSLGGCTRRGVAKSCGSGSLRKRCRGQYVAVTRSDDFYVEIDRAHPGQRPPAAGALGAQPEQRMGADRNPQSSSCGTRARRGVPDPAAGLDRRPSYGCAESRSRQRNSAECVGCANYAWREE